MTQRLTQTQSEIIDRCARRAASPQEGNELRWIIHWLTMRAERAERDRAEAQAELWKLQHDPYVQEKP